MAQLKRYKLDVQDFENFRKLISDASGIFYDQGKKELLTLGLGDRADVLGADSLHEYYRYITESPDRETELRLLLDHLSVGETNFFRNLPQFDALRKYVIPDIVQRKVEADNRILRFWSAGCSTGQEPYSIAMAILDVLPDTAGWNIQVMGTDLSDESLETARRGWYQERKLNGLDREHLQRYFRAQDGGYVVNEPVQRLVNFSHHNMVTEPLPITQFGTCDIIFCRNVIIYFAQETAKYVIELFYDILNPGGYLFLGHSETLWRMSAKYSLVEIGDAFIYKKSLPRSMDGKRFIPDRRMRDSGLPPGVTEERRLRQDRRTEKTRMAETAMANTGVTSSEEKSKEQERLLGEARLLLNMGDPEKAMEKLSHVLQEDSTCAQAHFLMGLAQENSEDPEAASESFRRTIYLNENHSLAYFRLASVMEQAGRLKSAVKYYRNAAHRFRQDDPGRWENDMDSHDVESLISLCEWKIENLGAVEG